MNRDESPAASLRFGIFHPASNNFVAECRTREEAETELGNWQDCEIVDFGALPTPDRTESAAATASWREALQSICTEIDVRLDIGLPPSMEDLRMWKRIIEEALSRV